MLFGILGMTVFQGKLHRCSDDGFVGLPVNAGEPPGSAVGWRENCVGAHVAFESQVPGLLEMPVCVCMYIIYAAAGDTYMCAHVYDTSRCPGCWRRSSTTRAS